MMTLLRPNCIGSENMILLVKLDGVRPMIGHTDVCKSLCGGVVERRRRAHVLDDRLVARHETCADRPPALILKLAQKNSRLTRH